MILSNDDTKILDRLFSGEHKYLSVASNKGTETTTIEDYCYGWVVVQISEDYPLWVVVVPERDAHYIADRLASGLHGARVHDTYDEAVERLGEMSYHYMEAGR